MYTQATVHAGAQPQGLRVGLARACATGLTAGRVVGDDEGVPVEHGALEAGVGAHVFAHLLTHEPGVTISGEAVEQHPEHLPRAHLRLQEGHAQFADRGEVADEGEACPQRNADPDHMLEGLLDEFFQRGRGLVQPHAQGAVTLDLALDPHEYLAVHRLRTGVAAPQPPGDCGEQEKGQGRNHEQAREVDEVLWVEHQPEDVEAACVQVKQHSLPLTPFEPWQAIEDQLRQKDHGPSPACKHALDGPGIDLLGRSVEGDGVVVVILHRRRDDGDDFAGVS